MVLVYSLVKWAAPLSIYHVHQVRTGIHQVLNVVISLLCVPDGYMKSCVPLDVNGLISLVSKKAGNVDRCIHLDPTHVFPFPLRPDGWLGSIVYKLLYQVQSD